MERSWFPPGKNRFKGQGARNKNRVKVQGASYIQLRPLDYIEE
jgi:hypothetical protein